ncbi:hypothetical protein [Bdellovibrio sp. HCB2-146]|uniref:hypothetical protein n=1 Tax=Bdellovibrio sp. HCB2-146 TaxID=3394362 RepID=UPI0039BCCFF2
MKIVMIAGSYPPDICGVGDYSEKLVHALEAKGLEVEVFRQIDLETNKHIASKIRDPKTICHIQYPAQGFGKKMNVQWVSMLARNSVVTIHEYSQSKFLRKLAEIPFFVTSKKLIFTNQYELAEVRDLFPFVAGKSTVIPISSNIPYPGSTNNVGRNGLLFFGLIRPNKGLEEYLECVSQLVSRGINMPFVIFGAVPLGQEEYYRAMRNKSERLPIEWSVNKSSEEVSKGMLAAQFAYLSYPDGLTERRGSFLASLFHDLKVLSNSGSATPAELMETFIDVATPTMAAEKIEFLFKAGVSSIEDHAVRAAKNRFSWEAIADKHLHLYESLLT